MPVKQSKLTERDPVVLNKKRCEERVTEFLTRNGFEIISIGVRNEPDIVAQKDEWKLAIEVRGNQAINHDLDTVFDSAQLNVHFSEQVYDVMRAYKGANSNVLHIIANPDIPRIRYIESNVANALNDMNIVRMWISDSSINITSPRSIGGTTELLFP